jgi:hypothetical protein
VRRAGQRPSYAENRRVYGIKALQEKLPDCKMIRDRFPKKDD